MSKVKLLTVMIPIFNEEECVAGLYEKLDAVSNELACNVEFLFVNDGSTDATLSMLQDIQAKDKRICIVDLSRNYGKEIAMTAGLDYLKGDTLVIIDADLQDSPSLLPLMLQEIENGYDDVYAQRTSRKGETWLKKTTSRWYYKTLASMSSVAIQKDTGDFRMLSSKAIRALRQFGENERNMKGLFSFIGFKKKAIYYERDERMAGQTKWNYFKLFNLAVRGITSFSTKPLRMISITGIVISLVSFVFLFKIVFKAIYYGDPVAGYPSIMSTILFLGGLQLLSIGVLGEYLGIIFSETKKRPIYFINDYYNLKSDLSDAEKNNLLSLSENQVGKFILLFTVLPFLVLCYFNVPLGDDFWYASAYIEKGFVDTQVQWFQEWSGRYMATFAISALNPLSYGHLHLAFIHPLLLIVGTVLSFSLLVNSIIRVFKLQINNLLAISILLFFYFNYVPDFGETFYWMAGAYTYQLPIIFFVLYLNSLLHLFKSKNILPIVGHSVIAICCLVIVLGCNEVIVVYSCFINSLVLLGLFFTNKKLVIRFLPLFLIALSLSVTMIFAPGNFARGALFEKPDFHVAKSVLNAFARGSFVMVFWLPTLAFMIMLLPNIYKIEIPNLLPDKLAFLNKKKLFFLGLVFLLLVLFIGFFPSIYTTRWIPQRAYTPIFFVFILFATVFIFIAINKIAVLNELNKILSAKPVTSVLLLIAIIALSHNSNVMNAYTDVTSGKAVAYNKQVTAAYNLLKTTKQDTVLVKEIDKKPLILPIRWPAKHNRLANTEWEEYFKVKNVELD